MGYVSAMLLRYRYRIYPNKLQEQALSEMLVDFCGLYNAALEQRIDAYRRRGVALRFLDQSRELKAARLADHGLARWSYSAEQQVLRRLEKTFAAFFSRGRGFPRFKARSRFRSADLVIGDGLTIRKSGRVRLVGIPDEIRVCWHRPLPSKPRSAVLVKHAGTWHISFSVDVAGSGIANPNSIGVDVGLANLVALSNGEMIARPNWTKRAAKGLRRHQRALARCTRGSNVRRKRKLALAKFQAHIAAKRCDFSHKVSRDLVGRFGLIAFENLNIKGLARSRLAKQVLDAAWAQIVSFTTYKAEIAGGEVRKIDPRGTSMECPDCGNIAKKTLDERMHSCPCGCSMPRDVASAIVIHNRAFTLGLEPSLGSLSQRVAA